MHSPSGIGAATDGAKVAGASVVVLSAVEGSPTGYVEVTGIGAYVSVSYMVGSSVSGTMVGSAVGMAVGSSGSVARVGSTVGTAGGLFDTGVGVGSLVREATGTAVSGTVVGSDLVELGVGAKGVAFPSAE